MRWRVSASTHRISRLVVPLRSGNSWMSVAPFRDLETGATKSEGRGQSILMPGLPTITDLPLRDSTLLGNVILPLHPPPTTTNLKILQLFRPW